MGIQFLVPFLLPLALRAGMLYVRPHVSGTEHIGYFEARHSWEPGSRLTTGEFSPFRLSPKVSGANLHWANTNHTFLTHKNPQTDTFLRDISPAKLLWTARVWNPQGISKLVNKVDCQVPCALLKAIVRAFLATKSFAAGSSTYPCYMACVSKSVPRDVISSSDCCPQRHRSAVDVACDSRGNYSASFSHVLQGSQLRKVVLWWYCFCMWLPHRKGT